MDISYDPKTCIWQITDYFDGELCETYIPHETRAIYLGYRFNQEIKINILPCNVNKIKFGYLYNKKFKKDILPKSTTHLELGYNYDHKIDISVAKKFNTFNYIKLQICMYYFNLSSILENILNI